MNLADRLGGKKVKCPQCGAAVEVPFAPLDPSASAPEIASDSSGSFNIVSPSRAAAPQSSAAHDSGLFIDTGDNAPAPRSENRPQGFAIPSPKSASSSSSGSSAELFLNFSPSSGGSSAAGKVGSPAAKTTTASKGAKSGKPPGTGKKKPGAEDIDDEVRAAEARLQNKKIAIGALIGVVVLLLVTLVVFSTMQPAKTANEQAKELIRGRYKADPHRAEVYKSIEKHHNDEFKASFTPVGNFDERTYYKRMDERIREDLIAQKLISTTPGEWVPPEMPMSAAEKAVSGVKSSPPPASSGSKDSSKTKKK